MRFAIFALHLSKEIAPATKKWCQVIRSAAPVRQNHLSKPEDRMLQNATALRKSAPSPPNSSDEDVSCTAPATENASLQILFKCPTPANACEAVANPSRFAQVQNPLRLPRKTTSEPSKVVRTWCFFFNILTWKRASHHNGVHFFDISISKSSLNVVRFAHFDFEMCFAPQRRTFSTSQLQKVPRCFVHFDFDVLRATTACNFSSRIWPDVAAPAALASLLFDPPGPQKHWKKHTESRLFYLFAHLHLLSSDSFSSLILVSSSLRLSDSSHLCSSFLHTVGSLTSKLPLVMLHVRVLKRETAEREREREREKKSTTKLLTLILWKPSLENPQIRMSAPSCSDVFAGIIITSIAQLGKAYNME